MSHSNATTSQFDSYYRHFFSFESYGNVLASLAGIIYCSHLIYKFERSHFSSQIHVILYWLCLEDIFCNVFILVKYLDVLTSAYIPSTWYIDVTVPKAYVAWIASLYHVNFYLLRTFSNLIIFHSLVLCINLFVMILLDREIYTIITVRSVHLFFSLTYLMYALLSIPLAFEYQIHPFINSNYPAIPSHQLIESSNQSTSQERTHSHSSWSEGVGMVTFSPLAHTQAFKVGLLLYDILLFIVPALAVIFINFVSYEIARRKHARIHSRYNPGRSQISFLTMIKQSRKGSDKKGEHSNGLSPQQNSEEKPVHSGSNKEKLFSNSKMRKLQLYMLMTVTLGILHMVCLGPKVVAIVIKKLLNHDLTDGPGPIWLEMMVPLTEILENVDSIPNFLLHFYSEKIFEAMVAEKRIKKHWRSVRANVRARMILGKF